MPTENRVCWEAAHHFWATLPVGVSHGSSCSPFLSIFTAFWSGLQPRVGTLFWRRAWLTHLHSLELESSITPPGADTGLLRPALRYTSLHAQYCTIPPHTLSLHNSAPALLESKTLHFTIYISPGAGLGHRQKCGGEAEHRRWQWRRKVPDRPNLWHALRCRTPRCREEDPIYLDGGRP